MKPFDNPNKKTYCYKSECRIVETGFQSKEGFFYVCTTCKEEVSDHLKGLIEERTKGKDKEDDLFSLFEELL